MGIFWPYIVSIEELNEKTNSERISIGMKKRRWRWLGHVLRIPRQHHCVTALTWKPDGSGKGRLADPRQLGDEQWRGKEMQLAGSLGPRSDSSVATDNVLDGEKARRAYVQQNTKSGVFAVLAFLFLSFYFVVLLAFQSPLLALETFPPKRRGK